MLKNNPVYKHQVIFNKSNWTYINSTGQINKIDKRTQLQQTTLSEIDSRITRQQQELIDFRRNMNHTNNQNITKINASLSEINKQFLTIKHFYVDKL